MVTAARGSEGGWNAVPAAVLVALLGLAGAVFSVAGGVGIAGRTPADAIGLVVFAGLVGTTVLLLTGSVLLLLRRPSGRWLVAGAASLTAAGAVGLMVRASGIAADPRLTWETSSPGLDGVLVLGGAVIAIALVALTLALLPGTGRWCGSGDEPDYAAAAHRLEERTQGAR